jgi:hypothetical protein
MFLTFLLLLLFPPFPAIVGFLLCSSCLFVSVIADVLAALLLASLDFLLLLPSLLLMFPTFLASLLLLASLPLLASLVLLAYLLVLWWVH